MELVRFFGRSWKDLESDESPDGNPDQNKNVTFPVSPHFSHKDTQLDKVMFHLAVQQLLVQKRTEFSMVPLL